MYTNDLEGPLIFILFIGFLDFVFTTIGQNELLWMPSNSVLETAGFELLDQLSIIGVVDIDFVSVACSGQVVSIFTESHLVNLSFDSFDRSKWSELCAVKDVDYIICSACSNISRAWITDYAEACCCMKLKCVFYT